MQKTLDAKLADIHADPASKAFILADAKDADMAFGMAAPGADPQARDGQFRSLQDYRDHIRRNVQQGLLDIMLMSVSTSEVLTIREGLFGGSPVTPAVRANDTTDVHTPRGGSYVRAPSRPFRTAVIDHAQAGRILADDGGDRDRGADLGLYSITFNNDVELDRVTLDAYRDFRIEAERKGFRHFLEVFAPNAPVNPVPAEKVGHFLNDLIARALAGVAEAGRPLFLKMVYTGPGAMEEIARYDPHLVPGILGGSAGTTYDAFKLLDEARKHGAKAALFGRKINNSEHQLTFIQFLRMIADGQIGPEDAVRAYHGVLEQLSIRPRRTLAQDMRLTEPALSYVRPAGATRASVSLAGTGYAAGQGPLPSQGGAAEKSSGDLPTGTQGWPVRMDGSPDFASMTPQQRLAYHTERLKHLG